jgi:hypothetical protein
VYSSLPCSLFPSCCRSSSLAETVMRLRSRRLPRRPTLPRPATRRRREHRRAIRPAMWRRRSIRRPLLRHIHSRRPRLLRSHRTRRRSKRTRRQLPIRHPLHRRLRRPPHRQPWRPQGCWRCLARATRHVDFIAATPSTASARFRARPGLTASRTIASWACVCRVVARRALGPRTKARRETR